MTTGLSQFIVILLLLFLLVGSGVLMWDGLATGFGHGRAAALHGTDHARARLAVGIVGFAIVAWIALGVLTHAW
ncbi:MAG: hypothetical protein WCC48_12835 [Anaeromyxobacteraceae bacterium]